MLNEISFSRKYYIFVGLGVLLLVGFFLFVSMRKAKAPSVSAGIPSYQKNESTLDAPRVSVLAENLDVPWSMVFLPTGEVLFTERVGHVKLVDAQRNLSTVSVGDISEVRVVGEGGLLGVALHPDFAGNKFVYFYYTYSGDDRRTLNRVDRFTLVDNALSNRKTILDAIPGAPNHNGGRIKFGPDGFLYVGTGDAQEPSLAQDVSSTAGKILRMTDEGSVPSDNPFGNLVYSYGHRNVQGLVWDKNNGLWATEHGPSGADELNRIEGGKNYGWPTISGRQTKEGMVGPVVNSGVGTWAPSGTAILGDSLFFAGLRGAALFKVDIGKTPLTAAEYLKGEFGRLRDVVLGPDGFLYVLTNNRDGRGTPSGGDDKILRINPGKL